eukprot:3527079-Rhodomonas_salina.1
MRSSERKEGEGGASGEEKKRTEPLHPEVSAQRSRQRGAFEHAHVPLLDARLRRPDRGQRRTY